MLVIHPTSTCDVCLDGYTGDSELIPHAIACGHVFCLTCIQSLRQLWCPLCRTPFSNEDIRRLHLDRSVRESPSPSPQHSTHTLFIDGVDVSPKIVDENSISDVATTKALDLQNRVNEFIDEDSLEDNVESMADEVRAFLEHEPLDVNPSLRAVFLLLGHIGKLQLRCSDMEKEQQELQNQHITARQATLDAERKCIDIQRERLQDKEAARTHEKALRDQHQTEKTELQRKIDELSKECRRLQEELNLGRMSVASSPQTPPPRPSSSSSSRQFYSERIKRRESSEDEDERLGFRYNDSNSLMLSLSPPREDPRRGRFHLSPVPSTASALPVSLSSESKSTPSTALRPYKPYEKSTSSGDNFDSDMSNSDLTRPLYSGISHASVSAQTAASSRTTTSIGFPVPMPNPSPQRREQSPDSSPQRSSRLDYFSKQQETSTSSLAHNSDVIRLYSILDSPLPLPVPPPTSNSAITRRPSRSRAQSRETSPARSTNYHSQSSRPSQSIPPVPALPMVVRPIPTSANSSAAHSPSVVPATYHRSQAPAISQSYTVGHIHSHPQAYVPTYTLNASPNPAKKTAITPQDQRLGQVRGQLERRGSFSSASAAAGVAQGSGSATQRDTSQHHRSGSHHRSTSSAATPAMVPPSALSPAPLRNNPVLGSGYGVIHSLDSD